MGRRVTLLGAQKKEERKELKKHAATIHSSNSLSLLQRKISNALLYHAYPELTAKEEYDITVKQLCRLIGYNGNNHAVIKDALKELISTVIEWNLINEESGVENWTASSILASVCIEGPLCSYAYSPRMKQLLHSPSMFGKIDLIIQSKFRSSYGLALYENCIRYRGLPHTKWFEMGIFKKLMGVDTGKYNIFRDFKRRVLDKAVDEVNTYSDLVVSSELFKEGRAIKKIRFKLKDRAKKIRLGPKLVQLPAAKTKNFETEDHDPFRYDLIDTFGLTSEQIDQMYNLYSKSVIEQKINLIKESKAFIAGQIQNLAGYLLSALRYDYQPIQPVVNQKKDKKDKIEFEIKQLKQEVALVRSKYSEYRAHMIETAFADLDKEQQQHIVQSFYQFAEPVIATILQLQRHSYTRETVMTSPQLKAMFRQFILRELENIQLLSLEDYVDKLGLEAKQTFQKLKTLDPDNELLGFRE